MPKQSEQKELSIPKATGMLGLGRMLKAISRYTALTGGVPLPSPTTSDRKAGLLSLKNLQTSADFPL